MRTPATIMDQINDNICVDNGRCFVGSRGSGGLLEVGSRDEAVFTLGYMRGAQAASMATLYALDAALNPESPHAKQIAAARRLRDALAKELGH